MGDARAGDGVEVIVDGVEYIDRNRGFANTFFEWKEDIECVRCRANQLDPELDCSCGFQMDFRPEPAGMALMVLKRYDIESDEWEPL